MKLLYAHAVFDVHVLTFLLSSKAQNLNVDIELMQKKKEEKANIIQIDNHSSLSSIKQIFSCSTLFNILL
jgi:hypothetical protein